jgi:hypothetical protein
MAPLIEALVVFVGLPIAAIGAFAALVVATTTAVREMTLGSREAARMVPDGRIVAFPSVRSATAQTARPADVTRRAA